MSNESQKFTVALSQEGHSFASASAQFGFDPATLISLIFPIVADMLKGCLIQPTQQAKMIKGQSSVVKAVIDRATSKALQQAHTQQFGSSGNYTVQEVKTLSRPCLEEAAKLQTREIIALLRG